MSLLLASDNGFLYGFLSWFKEFFSYMLKGLLTIFQGIYFGIIKMFDFPYYFDLWKTHSSTFSALDWVVSIIAFILTFAIWFSLLFLIILGIRKFIRFRKTLVGNEDLLEEIADLHRDVIRLSEEKERIMQLKVTQAGLSYEQMKQMFETEFQEAEAVADQLVDEREKKKQESSGGSRFVRLSKVDEQYAYNEQVVYEKDISLQDLCDDIRNFACSKHKLYYEIRTIRLMIAGLASTKLIILQGISGTGKTSLPYMMGKYFEADSTIASVQPSWRDRNELFGYFNEFTKKFNETEVLKRIYESSYNDNVNIIILDEMNIARVEYYFAEMLSVLEMPNPNEWKLELVPSRWDNDPVKLVDGALQIPQNVWYVGTINNDDSTFSVSDKVYDRAFVINLDSKGIPFEAPETTSKRVAYSHIDEMYKKAMKDFAVSEQSLDNIAKLDNYVIDHFRVAFGNRIMKQLKQFVPVYVACGGEEVEAIDYMLMTKVFRKFESLNISVIRDEIRGLLNTLDSLFGKGKMKESIAYLSRLQKLY